MDRLLALLVRSVEAEAQLDPRLRCLSGNQGQAGANDGVESLIGGRDRVQPGGDDLEAEAGVAPVVVGHDLDALSDLPQARLAVDPEDRAHGVEQRDDLRRRDAARPPTEGAGVGEPAERVGDEADRQPDRPQVVAERIGGQEPERVEQHVDGGSDVVVEATEVLEPEAPDLGRRQSGQAAGDGRHVGLGPEADVLRLRLTGPVPPADDAERRDRRHDQLGPAGRARAGGAHHELHVGAAATGRRSGRLRRAPWRAPSTAPPRRRPRRAPPAGRRGRWSWSPGRPSRSARRAPPRPRPGSGPAGR